MKWHLWLGWVLMAAAGGVGYVVGTLDYSAGRPSTSERSSDVDWSNPLQPAYIGSEGCAKCHPDQAAAHAQNGHAHTFFLDHLAEQFPWLAEERVVDPERRNHVTYVADGSNLVADFRDNSRRERLPIQFALGSGAHATTFINLLATTQGDPEVLEHRFSLFHHGDEVGLTPSHAGLSVHAGIDDLGRIHRGKDAINCIACHTTTGRIQRDRLDDLRPNVGCESCHGPGREHAAAMESSSSPPALRFGKSLTTPLEEIQMCGRCHRLPSMLSSPPSKSDPKLTRFQPVGILNSECYRRSDERMRCTTCHDPHATVDRNAANYTAKCLNCHSQAEQGHHLCPKSPRENCVICHMPAVEVHPGISFHDHWIRVRASPSDPP